MVHQPSASLICLHLFNKTSHVVSNSSHFGVTPCHSHADYVHAYSSLPRQPKDPEPFIRVLAISICLMIVILLENGLVILAFSMDKCLRKRSANILVFSQAAADVFTGLIFMPVNLAESSQEKKNVTPFIITYMLFISLFNLFALAFDRYLALRKPFLHHRLMDMKRTVKFVVFIWSTPLPLTLIPLSWWFKPLPLQVAAFRIYLGIAWSLMLLLVSAMTVLYLFITAAARKTIRSRRKTICVNLHEEARITGLAKKELRVAHLFGLLLFFFVLAYFPILYMNLCDILGRVELIPEELQATSFYFLILNSVVNPLLCISLKRDYQIVVKAIIFRPQYLHHRHTSNCPFRSCSYTKNRGDSEMESHVSERKFALPRRNCGKSLSLQLHTDGKSSCSSNDSDVEMEMFKVRVAKSSPASDSSYLSEHAKSLPKNVIAERERLLSILMESSNDFERVSESPPKFNNFECEEAVAETNFQAFN